MRSSRSRKGWCGAQGLAERMIRAPRAIAFIERRRLGFVKESFFIADFLERAVPLPHYVRDRWQFMGVQEKRKFCRELGGFLAGLHRRGAYHTDLKGSNLMVGDGQRGRPFFYLLDPEAVRFVVRLTPRMAIRNLSRLDRYMRSSVSATDRLETLSSYLGSCGWFGRLGYFWRAIRKIDH